VDAFEASAVTGHNVIATVKKIVQLTIVSIREQIPV
jgi:hypothetical protein